MRYIKRILLILFLVIMISGCSVDYRIKINDDLSVREVAYISENTDRMKSRTNLDVDKSVKYLYDIHKRNQMGSHDYSITSSNQITRVYASNSYKNLDEFSRLYSSDITDSPIIRKEGDIVHLSIVQTNYIDSNASTKPVYDDITVTIEVPFKVIYNNAEKVDGNKYIWTIRKDDELKTIKISFNPKNVNKKVSLGFGERKVNVAYEYILIIGLVIVVAIIIIFIYFKNKKINKI